MFGVGAKPYIAQTLNMQVTILVFSRIFYNRQDTHFKYEVVVITSLKKS